MLRLRPLRIAVLLAAAACLGPDQHRCASGVDCPGGTCEAAGFCSFPGATCQQWGAGAGSLAGSCVIDGGVDAAGDGGDGLDALDATIDASADRDSDVDGVRDVDDNCPGEPNADQHDEDGDGTGDACDNCPVTASPSQLNADDDDLGDICDPSVMVSRNWIVAFEPWAGAPVGVPGWTSYAGTWSVSGDAVVVMASTQARMQRPLVVPVGTSAVFVDVGFTVDSVMLPATLAVMGPVDFDNSDQTVGGTGCALRSDSGGKNRAAVASATVTSSTTVDIVELAKFAMSLTAPATGTLQLQRRGTANTCRLALAAGAVTAGFDSSGSVTHLGVIARGVSARLHYLFAYTD